MKTDDLIRELAEEAKPVKPVKPFARTVLWLAFSFFAITAVLLVVGIRQDVLVKAESTLFLVELSTALATGILAAFAANWLSLPDVRQQKWVVWLPVLPLTFLCMVVAYNYAIKPVHMEMHESLHCVSDMLWVIIVPSVVLFFLLRHAATTRCALASVMALLAVVAFGYVCSRLMCQNDDPLHLLLWHYLPVLGITLAGAFFGSRILRW